MNVAKRITIAIFIAGTLLSLTCAAQNPAVIVQGKPLTSVQPAYPPEAKGITGTVVLKCVVEEDGSVNVLHVVSSPDPLLTDAAIAAVKQWTYTPYTLNGIRTPGYPTISVNFTK